MFGGTGMKKGFILLFILLLLFSGVSSGAAQKERSWQDESIYYITVDRFNNSDFNIDFDVDANDPDRYHGGDFQGIIDRLDYIKDLGFTAIGLSSIFDNEDDGYHGYWIKDYFNTEEHFGSIEKFRELVKQAHNRELKVIIDFVVVPSIDKNTIIDAAKWWVAETDIDGYRLDSTEPVSAEIWQELTKEIKQVDGDFFLLGDIREDSQDIIKYQDAGMDGFFNYSLNEELRVAFSKPDTSLDSVAKYDNDFFQANFMDNQHTHRFTRDTISINEHPGPRWKLALTYLYTTPGIPFVFYGSEIALDGGEEPDNQRQMDFRTDKELIEYITNIAKVRRQLPSLTRGSYEVLHEENGMIVYKREYEGETTVVALNNTTKSQSVTISTELEDNKELRGLLNSDLVRSEEGKYKIIIDRDEAEVYLLAEKTGLNIPFIVVTAGVVILFLGFLFLAVRRSKKANN